MDLTNLLNESTEKISSTIELSIAERSLLRNEVLKSSKNDDDEKSMTEKLGSYGCSAEDDKYIAELFATRFSEFLKKFKDEAVCNDKATMKLVERMQKQDFDNMMEVLAKADSDLPEMIEDRKSVV